MKSINLLVVFLLILFGCDKKLVKNESKIKPNIIYILADDLGYGDLSSYGQKKFITPNIDALAKEGLLFTQHYAGSTVCAPSRASLMTGQHTGHTVIRGNKSLELPLESFTLAKMLKANGYATGGFGKWGLGTFAKSGSPLKQGFDTFYGFQSQWLAHNYYPNQLRYNDTKIT
ncbi:MAG: sulfatase-like hydrolase/transferase, partial [Polaribacter sp.]